MTPTQALNIAARLGCKLKRTTASEWCGPCPVCGGRDRFSFSTAKMVWHCRGCAKGGDILDLIQHVRGGGFKDAKAFAGEPLDALPPQGRAIPFRRAEAPPAPAPDDAERVAAALAIWEAGEDLRRSAAARSYFKSRALDLPEDEGDALRWHAASGAMLGLFRNIHTDEPQGVSRTFLSPSGAKLGRKFLGRVGGGAIKIDPDDSVTLGLFVGEGIETCLAARQIGLRPVWALGSAGAIAAFPVLGGSCCLTLLAEHDEASARAVQACGERWDAAGREVHVIEPTHGKDLNDAVRGAARG